MTKRADLVRKVGERVLFKDPLAADEDAPQMILQRINKDKVKEEERQFGVFYEVIFFYNFEHF